MIRKEITIAQCELTLYFSPRFTTAVNCNGTCELWQEHCVSFWLAVGSKTVRHTGGYVFLWGGFSFVFTTRLGTVVAKLQYIVKKIQFCFCFCNTVRDGLITVDKPKFIFAAMCSQPFSTFSSVEKESCFESEHKFCYRVQIMAKSKIT
jgi:hypothetical protein